MSTKVEKYHNYIIDDMINQSQFYVDMNSVEVILPAVYDNFDELMGRYGLRDEKEITNVLSRFDKIVNDFMDNLDWDKFSDEELYDLKDYI
jgi:hypothetical protein